MSTILKYNYTKFHRNPNANGSFCVMRKHTDRQIQVKSHFCVKYLPGNTRYYFVFLFSMYRINSTVLGIICVEYNV